MQEDSRRKSGQNNTQQTPVPQNTEGRRTQNSHPSPQNNRIRESQKQAYRSAAPYTPAPRKNQSAHVPYPPSELQRRRQQIMLRKRKLRRKRMLFGLACIFLLTAVIGITVWVFSRLFGRTNTGPDTDEGQETQSAAVDTVTDGADTEPDTEKDSIAQLPVYYAPRMLSAEPLLPAADESTVSLQDEINCPYALLVNCSTGKITAEKNSGETIFPASMTKLMTVLVAYENIQDLNATYRMTNDIIDPLYLEGLSLAGFTGNEDVLIWDLLYGSALPSGAEASVALALAACGTEDAFVDKMNERAASLGMNGTHFVNCTGAHDENHYSTLSDIAILMCYVMENEDLYEIFSTYQYITSPTTQHPDGILLTSTVFSRMEGSESVVCTVIGGKTGFTAQAQQCLATYAVKNDTKEPYVCVTAGGDTKWRPIYDTIYLYQYCT
ncbi:MAG: D-alanyl-D-alanine carboxypeptidase family protein [Eubacteriales bacterium]